MVAASVALLGRTSELTRKSSKSDEQARRVRLPSLATDDAESTTDIVDMRDRLASKASCCSTPSTSLESWGTSRLSCPTEDDLDSEVDSEADGVEEHGVRSASLLSFMRVRTNSSAFGMPDTPASMSPASLTLVSVMHTDGLSMDTPASSCPTEDDADFEADGTEEHDVRQASLLSFMRVRTDSMLGMPVSPATTSPEASAIFSTMSQHAEQGRADQANAIQVQLFDLLGGQTEPTNNAKPGADATEGGSAANVTCALRPCLEPSPAPFATPTMPPLPLCTGGWAFGMVSPATAATLGMMMNASPKVDGHGYGSDVCSEQYLPAQQSHLRIREAAAGHEMDSIE